MYYISIDLGGTIIKVGLVREGEVLCSLAIPVLAGKGFRANLPALETAINKLTEEYSVSNSNLGGIGLAFPGLVNSDNCSVIATNEKYNDAVSFNFTEWANNHWNVPFVIDNDSRLATVGEWKYGAGRGNENLVMMTIGTGIGTGVIFEGKVLRGKHFQAGSLGGHFILDYKARNCTCGNTGCVEALSSSFFLPNIIKDFENISDDFKDMAPGMNFERLFSLYREGNKDAKVVCEHCMNVWGAAVVTYIHAYDPEAVVLGGGIMKSKDIILPYVKEIVDKQAWSPSEKVIVKASELNDNAALLGIAYCLQNRN